MKILFLTHRFYPDIGGIEINSEILAKAFCEAGHEVLLLTWSKNSDNRHFPFTVIRNPSVADLLKAHKWADVVYENNPCLRMSWPSVFFKRKSVVAIRTWLKGKSAWQEKLKKQFLKRAAGVIAVSNKIQEKCWPSAVVIGNPYRDDLFKTEPNVPRNKEFVFLGRLVSDKGASVAIKAFYQLLVHRRQEGKNFDNISFTIIGDGPERPYLEELVAEAGITKQVHFAGSLTGNLLVNCLNHHRFLVVPSVWEEPFGNIVLEGMACGCIPIVTDGGGLPDAAGNAGLIVPRKSISALSHAMNELLDDPGLAVTLRANAAGHLANHLPEKVSRRYLDVIESVYTAQTN